MSSSDQLKEILRQRIAQKKVAAVQAPVTKAVEPPAPQDNQMPELSHANTETVAQREKRLMNDESAWDASSLGMSRSILPR